jgi:hypothetical protein
MRVLHTPLLGLLVSAFLGAAASHAADAPAPGLHPLTGTWSWTAFGSKCVETFEYRSTKTMLSTSGEAIAEWNYTVTPNANDKGFYEVVETSMRHNGKRDCSGDTVDSTGIVNIRFIQFSPARDRMLVCREPSLAACFGPLRRQR